MKILKPIALISGLFLIIAGSIYAVAIFSAVRAQGSFLPAIRRGEESVPTLVDNSLGDGSSPTLPPLSHSEGGTASGISRLAQITTIIPNRPRVDVDTYEVQAGDNLFKIAERYALRPETVLWGNYDVLRDNPQFMQPGQVLNILPVNGVYYQWNDGDNLAGIADFFGVEAQAILEYPGNQFDLFDIDPQNPPIDPGTWLIVPGGLRELKDWGPPAITRSNPAAAQYYGAGYCGQVYEGAIGTGTFVWPTTSRQISGYDFNPSIHPGLDIGGAEGNAVYATDSGVVVFSGWSEYGYGYLIVLDHGNGWQSAYAHLSGVGVTCGQSVAQATVIGNVGNTGNSSGSHLHFEMRSEIYGKANPWNFIVP